MNFLSKFIGTKWAMCSEDASILATNHIRYSETEDGFYTNRKEGGDRDLINTVEHRGEIAVIKVDGSLVYRGDDEAYWAGLDSYDSIGAAFDECLADNSVKGIVFDINSPGGEVNGVADLANKIFEARGSKPFGIVARTGGMMCSAAYWLGSSCEKVYSADNGILGSIGVLCSFTKWNSDLIKTQVVVSDLSPNKVADPETDEGMKLLKKELNDLAGVFVDAVARNRGTTAEDVLKNYGKGGKFVGANAVNAGLADGVISLDALCEEMKKGTHNGGAVMATTTKQTPAANESVDLEAIKAQAVADYKARQTSMNEAFAGVNVTAEEKESFLADESKTVADAQIFVLGKAKEQIKAMAEENAKLAKERDEFKAKAEAAPAADANLTEAQKTAIKNGLQAEASAANSVQGSAGEANPQASADAKALDEICAQASKNFYNK